jgi:hypothetical protein
LTPEERQTLIARYADGYDEVMRSLEGFPAEALTARLIDGKWTAREIIHHLADSEMASALRLRQLLDQEAPVIQGYDQDMRAERLRYNERDTAPAFEAFRGARAVTVQVLKLMTEDDWQRAGTHTESGRYTTEDWLRIYAAHAHGHADQIRRLKAVIGDG